LLSFAAEEGDAVRPLLMSNKVNYWTGTECRPFEKVYAAWNEIRYAIAVANVRWRSISP
jgi:dTDP-4-amino-4,6-dideoxygalactose transaminase